MDMPKLIRLRAGTSMLYLAQCRFGNAGIKIMTKGFWVNLQVLDLRDKKIGEEQSFMTIKTKNLNSILEFYVEYQ